MEKENLAWARLALENRFTASSEDAKFDYFLGIRLVAVEEGQIILESDTADQHRNLNGVIHGGVLASIADIAMGSACFTLKKRVVTLDMNVGYIKNVPVGSTIRAIGKVMNEGRKIIRTSCEIYHEDLLLTKVYATFYVTGEYREDSYENQ